MGSKTLQACETRRIAVAACTTYLHSRVASCRRFDLQPESDWAEACRDISQPIRSIQHLDYFNRAETSNSDERIAYHELAWNRPVWTQPAHLKFFKLRYGYGHDDVYGLADTLEADDIIFIPGELRVALILRGCHTVAKYWV